jgi:hypothetical protein
MCEIVERARRRRLARAQQLVTAEEDQWQAMEKVWLILQLFLSEDESVQAAEKVKNAGPVVAKTRLVVGSLERVWRKFIHVHGGKVGLKPLPAEGFVEVCTSVIGRVAQLPACMQI